MAADSDAFANDAEPVRQAICREALPIWSRQIDTVRSQMDEAVAPIAGEFQRILADLCQGVAAADLARARRWGNPLAVVAESQRELGEVVETRRATRAGQAAIVEQLNGLMRFTGDLDTMATQMHAIAWRTKMLALNSAIKAAHAGRQGLTLAVIAGEIHLLAVYSAETSSKMGQIASTINDAIKTTVELFSELMRRDAEAISTIAASIDRMIEEFKAVTQRLSASGQTLQRTNGRVQGEIGQLLQSLEFAHAVNDELADVSRALTEPMTSTRPKMAALDAATHHSMRGRPFCDPHLRGNSQKLWITPCISCGLIRLIIDFSGTNLRSVNF